MLWWEAHWPFYYSGGAFKRDVLVCSTEFNFTRNEGRTSEVKMNTVAQFYFHRDGTGLTTYKGAARAGGQNLIVDRDVEFTWKQRDDDKVIVLSYTKTGVGTMTIRLIPNGVASPLRRHATIFGSGTFAFCMVDSGPALPHLYLPG